MAENNHPVNFRDGSSQSARSTAALKPDYAPIDERSPKDLLAFIARYAEQLNYFDEHNEVTQNWRQFFNPGADSKGPLDEAYLDAVIRFMEDPESVSALEQKYFTRPHFVLLLAFVKLLRHAGDHLNTLTERHLDFYFRSVLKFAPRLPVNDRASILVELARSTDFFALEKGTEISAGTDSQGRELLYRTEDRVELNKAKISTLISSFTDKREIDMEQCRIDALTNPVVLAPAQNALIEMLRLALGRPSPGDTLPEFSNVLEGANPESAGIPFVLNGNPGVDFELLADFGELFTFITGEENLSLKFIQLHEMMDFKWRRSPSPLDVNYLGNMQALENDWNRVQELLESTGITSPLGAPPVGSSDFTMIDFVNKFQAAFWELLGFDPYDKNNFADLANINHIDEVYRERHLTSVIDFIENREGNHFAHPLSLSSENFEEMMQIKLRVEGEWRYINELISIAAQAKSPPSASVSITDAKMADFDGNITTHLSPGFPGNTRLAALENMDTLYAGIQLIEQYFALPVGDMAYLIASVMEEKADWSQVESILNEAYFEKESRELNRRWRIQLEEHKTELLENAPDITEENIFIELADQVLGEAGLSNNVTDALSNLSPYLSSLDVDILQNMYSEASAGVSIDSIVILARAAEQKYRISKPVVKEEWNNLYFHEDAKSVVVSSNDTTHTHWRTFGETPKAVDATALKELGWLLSAGILNLQEGLRTINLTLTFSDTGFDYEQIDNLLTMEDKKAPLRILLSAEEGWLEVEPEELLLSRSLVGNEGKSLPVITIKLVLAEDIDAIINPGADAHGINCDFGTLKLMLRQELSDDEDTGSGHYRTAYPAFKNVLLEKAELGVSVVGLSNLALQNDTRNLDNAAPFEPFGGQPEIGSRFYLSHPEIASKQLTALGLNIEWMGLPEDITEHYKNYSLTDAVSGINADSFKVKVDLYQQGRIGPYKPQKSTLAQKTLLSSIQLNDVDLSVYTAKGVFEPGDTVKSSSHYLCLELDQQDFEHSRYNIYSNKKSTELALKLAGQAELTNTDAYLVPPPYTPKIKSMSLDYSAVAVFSLLRKDQGSSKQKVLNVHPFGYSKISGPATESGGWMLPQYDNAGELYIGLEGFEPPRTLSFLLQMAEGTAAPDLEQGKIQWSILEQGYWKTLPDKNILRDATHNLTNSGIVVLSLPEVNIDQPDGHNLLPGNQYWIRLAIDKNTRSVCDMVDIHTQAVSAVLVDDDYAAEHYQNPLSAEQITQLKEPLPGVKNLQQPYSSFGGKPAENNERLYVRASERLRHKNRALNVWDYEHLVLEAFPQLHKVKCIDAGNSMGRFEPGAVTLVVIPDVYKILTSDPFEPKASVNLIAKVQRFIDKKKPHSARVIVKNPVYVPVKVRLGVRFNEGYSESVYKEILNKDINRFVSPWAFKDTQEIAFGNKIYANDIISFVDSQVYIDYVADIKLFVFENNNNIARYILPGSLDGYYASVNQADAILVTARQHEIDIIPETGYSGRALTGIEFMKLELDFIVP